DRQAEIARLARQESDRQAGLARQAQGEAEASAGLARRQRDLTFDMLNKLVYEVQEQLQDRPPMHPLRDSLLGAAIGGLEQVAETDKGAGPRYSIASAHQLRGDICFALGRTDEAKREYEGFLQLSAELAKAEPGNPSVARNLGLAHAKLGDVSLRRGDA